VEILVAAQQHAVLHNPDTLDPEVSKLNGRERAKRFGGHGTPEVAEFAAAEFGARLGLSPYSARELIGDALDLSLRFPQLWARVQALYVDGRVAEPADGRVTWSRFESIVEAAIKAADPVAAAEREREASGRQFAKATQSQDDGIRGFYIRAQAGVIARLDAMAAYLAEALRQLGDDSSVDQRRVMGMLLLTNPFQAGDFLKAYWAWKDRLEDPDMPGDGETAAGGFGEGTASGGCSDEPRTGEKPVVDWSELLPAVVLYVPVLDLAGQAPVDSYEIPDRHRQAVHLMTPADTFPFSSCISRSQQVDHTVAFRRGPDGKPAVPGQSRVGNYGPMTQGHHRVKTFCGWQVQQPFPGIYVWRDPHGAFYLVDHTGSRRIDRPAADRPAADRPAAAGQSGPEVASRRGGSVLELYTSDVHLDWAA